MTENRERDGAQKIPSMTPELVSLILEEIRSEDCTYFWWGHDMTTKEVELRLTNMTVPEAIKWLQRVEMFAPDSEWEKSIIRKLNR